MVRKCAWHEIGRIITDRAPTGWHPPLPDGRLVIAAREATVSLDGPQDPARG
jgi:hypothetical protein